MCCCAWVLQCFPVLECWSWLEGGLLVWGAAQVAEQALYI